jgi:glycosyltransferase involved in cell wall biosynthesis
VGEFVRRKNFGALVKAFCLEFEQDEPVQLVLKTSVPGLGPPEAAQRVRQFCCDVQKGLRLWGREQSEGDDRIKVVTDRLSDDDLLKLHAACDCFVCPSYGEAWCYPAMDAMAMGKTPICTGWSGFTSYLSGAEGWLVDYRLEPCFGAHDACTGLYAGSENWASVDVNYLRRCMRAAFSQERARKEKSQAGVRRAYDFSYEVVGRRLLGALHGEGALEER